MIDLRLADGFRFEDLYSEEGLTRLDQHFLAGLEAHDGQLCVRLESARAASEALEPLARSELLLALAGPLDDFIARLFDIARERDALTAQHGALEPLYRCKRLFVQRRADKKLSHEVAAGLDGAVLEAALAPLIGERMSELAFARCVIAWLEDEKAHEKELDLALRFAAWALHNPTGKARFRDGILFKTPAKRDPEHLIALRAERQNGIESFRLPDDELRRREGFALTDRGFDLTGALDQANYCIFCHNRGKDSCSHGLKEKDGGYRKNFFAEPLCGCPLEEKISEMNMAKASGQAIGALAIVVTDNPMLPATGHHICNDCMKGCIYQKQEPVDIPQVETRVLKDVLALPWGFEIYSLLTRWNPLNFERPLPRPSSGRKVLIAGMGPAGFTLAHHLLNDGHWVVGIDGLKIEPLPGVLSGRDGTGESCPFEPIRDVESLYEALGERVMAGFGGLSEYGITVRWNKNFLKLIRLVLERRERFRLFGATRLGGAITIGGAFEMGFDHVALTVGAGSPTTLAVPNGLAPGVRAASDFLMALQLSGAAKKESVANMQIRLPVVVVGGGLTSIDAATESLAYYPFQVEKFLARYETLVDERGEAGLRAEWSAEERVIADEFMDHARAIRAEREAAKREKREARIRELVQGWGGVTIVYRKRLIDSPMYRLNPEEVEFALQEGFRIVERLAPERVEVDGQGYVRAITFAHQERDGDGRWRSLETVESFPARTILIAAGTRPNTVIAREEPERIGLDGRYFQAVDEEGAPVAPEPTTKPGKVRIFASVGGDHRSVSFYGDAHPSYAGNVVKAMASATQGYPLITRMMSRIEMPRIEMPRIEMSRIEMPRIEMPRVEESAD
ncbi:MAG: FAD-dependent oxidoreductase, partial [Proteobacteria bacterium]|nr:FAD-dependent oxidoreductase [Pseudomonadota bacterium]